MGQTVDQYNAMLNEWDIAHGVSLKEDNGFVYIDEYVDHTVYILQKLLALSESGNDGQSQVNAQFLKTIPDGSIDPSKKVALEHAFASSKVMAIYGAAGTGKCANTFYYVEQGSFLFTEYLVFYSERRSQYGFLCAFEKS